MLLSPTNQHLQQWNPSILMQRNETLSPMET
jgi:hypothetical protein